MFDQEMLIGNLTHLRGEWERACGDESLIDEKASVGLLLHDVVMALGLPHHEQKQVLGGKLYRELLPVVAERLAALAQQEEE